MEVEDGNNVGDYVGCGSCKNHLFTVYLSMDF